MDTKNLEECIAKELVKASFAAAKEQAETSEDRWNDVEDLSPDFGVPLIVTCEDGSVEFPVYRLIEPHTWRDSYYQADDYTWLAEIEKEVTAWMYMPMPYEGC